MMKEVPAANTRIIYSRIFCYTPNAIFRFKGC